jgi:hypothetical protein
MPTKPSNEKQNSSYIQLAHDEEFLYIAIVCQKIKSLTYEKTNQPRPRDSDLSKLDRMTLRIDSDRDVKTFFELQLDHRGWSSDALTSGEFGRNSNWNPTWYIAQNYSDTTWTIEAAIRLSELTADPNFSGQHWGFSALREFKNQTLENWPNIKGQLESERPLGLIKIQ